ncbi:MAG: hypothetical protein ACK5B9_03630 [Flavobacteriia bacterium]|jgi:hypothetical protein
MTQITDFLKKYWIFAIIAGVIIYMMKRKKSKKGTKSTIKVVPMSRMGSRMKRRVMSAFRRRY